MYYDYLQLCVVLYFCKDDAFIGVVVFDDSVLFSVALMIFLIYFDLFLYFAFVCTWLNSVFLRLMDMCVR
jgi:hypothetical protein